MKLVMGKFYVIFFSGLLSGLVFSIFISFFFLISIRKVKPEPRKVAKVVVVFLIFLVSSFVLGPIFSTIYGFFFYERLGFYIYFAVVFTGIGILSNLIAIVKKIKDLKIIIFLNLISGLIFATLPPLFFNLFSI